MGIWIELGIFLVVLAWGGWQWWDVRRTLARTRAQKAAAAAGRDGPTDPR